MREAPESSESPKPPLLVSFVRFLAQYRCRFLAAYLIALSLLVGTLVPTFKGIRVTVLGGRYSCC